MNFLMELILASITLIVCVSISYFLKIEISYLVLLYLALKLPILTYKG